MTSWTSVTTKGMMVKGLPTQVASAIMPTFMTCASICPKPATRWPAPSLGGNQDAGRPQHRIDDIALPERELLHRAGDTREDKGLVEIDLRLRQRGFRARLLGRQKRFDLGLQRLLVRESGVDRALPAVDHDLQALDLALRDGACIFLQKLGLHLKFVHGLLIGALRLDNQPVGGRQFGLRYRRVCLDLRDAPARRLPRRLLFRAVKPEQRGARLDLFIQGHEHLGDAAACSQAGC